MLNKRRNISLEDEFTWKAGLWDCFPLLPSISASFFSPSSFFICPPQPRPSPPLIQNPCDSMGNQFWSRVENCLKWRLSQHSSVGPPPVYRLVGFLPLRITYPHWHWHCSSAIAPLALLLMLSHQSLPLSWFYHNTLPLLVVIVKRCSQKRC